MLHIGSHQNDVWLAEEDEEEMMVVLAFVLFFLSHLHIMVEARPLLCSEIDMHNES